MLSLSCSPADSRLSSCLGSESEAWFLASGHWSYLGQASYYYQVSKATALLKSASKSSSLPTLTMISSTRWTASLSLCSSFLCWTLRGLSCYLQGRLPELTTHFLSCHSSNLMLVQQPRSVSSLLKTSEQISTTPRCASTATACFCLWRYECLRCRL